MMDRTCGWRIEVKMLKDSGGKTSSYFPRAVNYGAVGSIMARELLHIFYQQCG